MEKFFTLNKFFFFFCILFALEFIGLQIVSYMHITNQAKLDGERIFNWNWPSKNLHCVAEVYKTKILKRSNNDAAVEVLASGHMGSVATKCAAILSYYRMNNKWFLGRVEFE